MIAFEFLQHFQIAKNYHKLASCNKTETDKKAQLSLTNPRNAKPCQKFLQFEVITSSSQVGNPVFGN